MNGIIHYLHGEKWSTDDKAGPICGNIENCRIAMKRGELDSFYLESVPPYLNAYPFEVGDDRPPLSVPAEEQIRFAMSIVSSHSERVQIAELCAPQARHIALAVLREYNATRGRSDVRT